MEIEYTASTTHHETLGDFHQICPKIDADRLRNLLTVYKNASHDAKMAEEKFKTKWANDGCALNDEIYIKFLVAESKRKAICETMWYFGFTPETLESTLKSAFGF